MKSKIEIQKKLKDILNNKSKCKTAGHDLGYVANVKIEKILRWILE